MARVMGRDWMHFVRLPTSLTDLPDSWPRGHSSTLKPPRSFLTSAQMAAGLSGLQVSSRRPEAAAGRCGGRMAGKADLRAEQDRRCAPGGGCIALVYR